MKIELTLEELLKNSDWAQVFADESWGNVSKETDSCPPGANVDLTPPNREDIVEIIAAVNGENEGYSWVGIFKLKDGRYLMAEGSCDYTGWDCRASNHLEVANHLEDIIQYGLSVEDKVRLEISNENGNYRI